MAEKPPKEQTVEVEIIPSLEPKLGREYVNFASVSFSPFDFTLTFCQAPSMADIVRLKHAEGGKLPSTLNVDVPSTIKIIVSEEVLLQLIDALKINHEKFLKFKKGKT
jgi:hypothetical protein